jgi:hypothetical protein
VLKKNAGFSFYNTSRFTLTDVIKWLDLSGIRYTAPVSLPSGYDIIIMFDFVIMLV